MAKQWAKVRPSFLLSFLACLVLLPLSEYVGNLAATKVTFRYQQSKSFGTLGRQDAQELRHLGETAYGLELSRLLLLSKTKPSFEQNLDALQKMRSKAAHELWPLINLQVAEDHAVLARLEEQANNSAQAAGHRQIAEDLLRSLGWRDVSESALNQLADRELHSSLRRKPEK